MPRSYVLTAKQRREVARRAKAGESPKVLAAEFGISDKTVSYHKCRNTRAPQAARPKNDGRIAVLIETDVSSLAEILSTAGTKLLESSKA